jgi:hypothetical protein
MDPRSSELYAVDIQIVTTDDERIKKLSPFERFKMVKKPIVDLDFIETMTGTLFTEGEIDAGNNFRQQVQNGMNKEELHNLNSTLQTSNPRPRTSILSETHPNAGAANQNEEMMKSTAAAAPAAAAVSLKYQAAIAVSETVPLEFPTDGDMLGGMNFVLSGKFPDYDSGNSSYHGLHVGKDTISDAIQDNGGKYSDHVTDRTDFLVIGDDPGAGKVRRAKDLDKRIIRVRDLHDLAMGRTIKIALYLREDARIERFSRESFRRKPATTAAAAPTAKSTSTLLKQQPAATNTTAANKTRPRLSNKDKSSTTTTTTTATTATTRTAAKSQSSNNAEVVSKKKKKKDSTKKTKKKENDEEKKKEEKKKHEEVCDSDSSGDAYLGQPEVEEGTKKGTFCVYHSRG